MSKRPSYREALDWIAANDDTEFMNDGDDAPLSVTASLVQDLWDKDDATIRHDLLLAIRRDNRRRNQ